MKFVFVALIGFLFSCNSWNEFHSVDIPAIANYPEYSLSPAQKRKTVVILADESGTEITDLLIPFNILSFTENFHIEILSQRGMPVSVWKGIFLIPHGSMETSKTIPDVIVLPANFHPEDLKIKEYIKKHSDKQFLSICEGARLIGESEAFRDYSMTSHASALSEFEGKYKSIHWKKDVKYMRDRNLISSAGVASSVEGSLALIETLLGREAVLSALKKIKYPHEWIKLNHSSNAIGLSDGLQIMKKVFFGASPKIGMELYEGIDELMLAAYLDTFNRTFPGRIESFGHKIKSKYGLILYPTNTLTEYDLGFCEEDCRSFKGSITNKIKLPADIFPFDSSLALVKSMYGERFYEVTRNLLDY